MGIAFGIDSDDSEIEKYFRSMAFTSLKWQEYQEMSPNAKMLWIRNNPDMVFNILSYLEGVAKGHY